MNFHRIACLGLLLAAAPRAFTVERSVSSTNPTILTWEFLQAPEDEAWDSVEIRLGLKTGLEIASRVISWPQSGPWAGARPRMEIDSGEVRIKAWRVGPTQGESAGPVPIATLSLELQSDSDLGFGDVEAGVDLRRYTAQAVGTLMSPTRARAGTGDAGHVRDALGRYRPAALKWSKMAWTMRGDALPSP